MLKKESDPLLRANRPVICFDLDGPLLDVSDRYYQLYRDLVGDLAREEDVKPAISLLSKGDYWKLKRKRAKEEEILRKSGLIDARLVNRYRRLRLERIESKDYLRLDMPWAGIADALHSLNTEFTLVVATLRLSRGSLLEQLGWLGLRTAFDDILSSQARVETSSRVDAKARMINARYDRASKLAWFIGDTETDILAGKALGCRTAGVSFGIRDESILMAADPDLLLRTPVELIDWLSNFSVRPGETPKLNHKSEGRILK